MKDPVEHSDQPAPGAIVDEMEAIMATAHAQGRKPTKGQPASVAKLLQQDRSYKDSLDEETGGQNMLGIGVSPYFEDSMITATLGSVAYHESVAIGFTARQLNTPRFSADVNRSYTGTLR